MKNLSIVLNVVLLIAVGVLYFLHFSKSETVAVSGSDETARTEQLGSLPIAYVNSDSLLSKYEYFKDKAEELEAKRVKLEAEFNNRAQGLQGEITTLQRTAQNMTMAQAKAAEENLMKKQQNLMQYQQSLQQELIREETKVNNELYDKVSNYLQDFGKQNNFQLVLTYTKGSGVLYADDSLNITNQVINGLNDEYKNPSASESSDTTETE